MRSRFQIKGHPIHVMLVSYPIALYIIALLCDGFYLWTGTVFWIQAAFWMMLFGLVGNLAANASGVIDFMAVLREAAAARQTAVVHLFVGWLLVVIYGTSLLLRNWGESTEGGSFTLAVILNLIGAGCVGLQGWFGGELVYKHHVGIAEKEK